MRTGGWNAPSKGTEVDHITDCQAGIYEKEKKGDSKANRSAKYE